MRFVLLLTMSFLTGCEVPQASDTPTGAIDPFREVGDPMAEAVDALYPRYRALSAEREKGAHASDTCDVNLEGRNTFGDRIAYAAHLAMERKRSQLSYIASAYKLPATLAANSLWSHELCRVTRATLEVTLRGRSIPSDATIQKAAAFSDEVNSLRMLAKGGDTAALIRLQQRWTRLLMCLGYVESLTTADTARSHDVAAMLGVERKPAGVKFYVDSSQSDPVSKNNIGLYQFSPASSGNVRACLNAWNARYPACAITTNLEQSGMVALLGSAAQTFNAFCGATKIRDMFSVQVNTQQEKSTHPDNKNGATLKSADSRCVTPFFHSSLSYNHFGPLQNSVNGNLDSLLSCVSD